MQKRFPAGQLTAAENATLQKVMQAFRAGGGGRGFGGGGWNGPPPGWSRRNRLPVRGNYIVFVRQNGEPTPVYIRTGLTDLDYSEVVSGLSRRTRCWCSRARARCSNRPTPETG